METLPKHFISSLKTLFSLLDEDGKGFVRLSDIECRWDNNTGVPEGVLEMLRKMTPSSGFLTFDIFVKAVKTVGTTTSGPFKEITSKKSNPQQQPTISNNYENIPPRRVGERIPATRQSVGSHAQGREAILAKAVETDISNNHLMQMAPETTTGVPVRRRDSRRHTLATGIDHGMMRQIQLLQQEKDMLSKGFAHVERAREWYMRRVKTVEQKLRNTGTKDFFGDRNIEAQQERLQLEFLRIQELNNQLSALIESSEKGLPIHMGLALVRSPAQKASETEGNGKFAKVLAQNQSLKREISFKSDRISQLERDKAQLIKQMFKVKSENAQNDTTFI